MLTKVKICGITNYEDGEYAAECGADAVGFLFAESPRRIEPQRARDILHRLEPFVTGVGVFVDSPVEEIKRILDVTGCTVAQLHGDEPESFVGPNALVCGTATEAILRLAGGLMVGYTRQVDRERSESLVRISEGTGQRVLKIGTADARHVRQACAPIA